MNKEELYLKNKKKAKIIKILTPITFWVLLALSLLCFILAIKNSFGNVCEMMSMLNTSNKTGEELAANYSALVSRYGEWVIGNGNMGFQIVFIDVRNVVFNGFMILYAILSFVFLVSAFVLGKWLLPFLKEKILQDNQDMVNLTILKNEDNK